jgi:hypothetical protein
MNRYTSTDAGRNHGCRVREIVYRGHRCFTMENEKLRVLIAADKGADILEFVWKPLDIDVLWHAPHGLRDAGDALASSPLSEGAFREQFAGGWYEMLPIGPVLSARHGAVWGHHGESTLLRWQYRIDVDTPQRIVVTCETRLRRIPLYVNKVFCLSAGSGTLRVDETIRNESPQAVDFLWGQHPTFGWPFLEEGCRVYVPPCVVQTSELPAGARLQSRQKGTWPQLQSVDGKLTDISELPAPEIRSHDFVLLEHLQDGWFAIVNPKRGLGWALHWDHRLFPVLGFWQLFRGGEGYPWYGQHYLAALEPACALSSLDEAVSNNSAIHLKGVESVKATWEATAFNSPLEVKNVLPEGVIQ